MVTQKVWPDTSTEFNMQSPASGAAASAAPRQQANPVEATRKMCTTPINVIGVQQESCLAWSADGTALAFVSGNHSIYVCGWNPEKGRFVVRHLLNAHRGVIKAMTFLPS